MQYMSARNIKTSLLASYIDYVRPACLQAVLSNLDTMAHQTMHTNTADTQFVEYCLNYAYALSFVSFHTLSLVRQHITQSAERLRTMPFSKKDAPIPVSVCKLQNGGVALTGGFLKDEEGWLCTSLVSVLEGQSFLALKRTSAGLHRFVGASLHHNGFLDALLHARNAACENIIELNSDRFDSSTRRLFIGPSTVTVAAPRYSLNATPLV